MSQYPYGGYGQYPPGQYPPHPPQQPYPYQQPHNPYATPAYTAQPTPAPAEGQHYAASQSSFDYNASRIPGLGIFSGSQAAAPFPPSNNTGWNTGAPGIGVPPFAPTPALGQGVAYPYPESQPQTSYVAPAPIHSDQNQSSHGGQYGRGPDDTVEEGELSEGEFEDIYDPKGPDNGSVSLQQQKRVAPPPVVRESSGSGSQSIVDTQETPLYEDGGEEEGHAHSKDLTEAHAGGRERSGSYSPHLSPREIQRDQSTSRNTNQGPDMPGVVPQPSSTTTSDVSRISQAPVDSSSPRFRDLPEAKKEAQKAILRLLPHGVKYQTYIEEGFDEKTIRGLFTELNLVPGPASPPRAQPPPAEKQAVRKDVGPVGAGSAAATSEKTEERKDRIARLLAAQAAKSASVESAKSPEAPNQPTAPTTAPAPAKTRAEKELLLQQKMEALKKSREARAQKAATQKGETVKASQEQEPPKGPRTAQKNESSLIGQPADAQVGASAKTQVQSPLPERTNTQSPTSQSASSAQAPGIPGLFLSSTPQAMQQANQRKRPVAADFVDYPTSNGSLKRPFGQSRQDSTLVIDISDGSDDEDVEMEMDSPFEDSPANPHEATALRKGPPLRDYPPLTNNQPYRQFSSPVPPLSHTPPVNGKQRESEYDRKMREIAEMKKKLAEMEAKKKAKLPSAGPETPSGGTGTPPEVKEGEAAVPAIRRLPSTGDEDLSDEPSTQFMSEAQSAKLPRRSELSAASRQLKRDRLMRISSLELPHVDADIEEKTRQLEAYKAEVAQRQADIARLEAELKQKNTEKNLLVTEVESLRNETPEPTPHLDMPPTLAPESERVSESSKQSPINQPSRGDGREPREATTEPMVQQAGQTLDETPEQGIAGTEQPSEPMEIDKPEEGPNNGGEEYAQVPSAAPDAVVDDHVVAASSEQAPIGPDVVGLETAADVDKLVDTGIADDGANASDIAMSEDMAIDEPSPIRETSVGVTSEPGEQEDSAAQPSPDTSSSSPASAEAEVARGIEGVAEPQGSSEVSASALPTHISNVDVPTNDAAFEDHAETAEPPREVAVISPEECLSHLIPPQDVDSEAPARKTSLTPYESPLRYFHAYRFHPKFSETVPGGLKSLTYSNRIQPKKEVCPYELDGKQCPNGKSCEYQHFQEMTAPDDQILLELGRSDEYTGEQKTRFVAGLRELLTTFRAQKIKDFPTIAQGIIEFRRRFLGDPSKVLHLEGVSV